MTFDAQAALTASGFDPRVSEVVAYAVQDDYAAALIDHRGDGAQRQLQLFRLTASGWSKPISGDEEAVSDGVAMAVWDMENQRVVIGYVQPDGEGGLAPMYERGPDPAGVLLWLTVQGIAFWPAVAGQYIWTTTGRGYLLLTLQFTMLAVIAFVILRNLVRLWRTPAFVPTRSAVLVPGLLALVFLAFSVQPLLLDDRWQAKPVGGMWLLIGVNLLLAAVREAMRLARRRRSAAA